MATYQVELVLEGQTDVWMTESVVDEIEKHDGTKAGVDPDEPDHGLYRKIKHYSENGFWKFEGAKRPIKHEGNGVYRIGYGDLFRIYGFYNGPGRREFIAIRPHLKRGQKNTARERNAITKVRRAKDNGDWEKIT